MRTKLQPLLIFLLAALWLPVAAQQSVDSLRRQLAQQKGEEKLETLHQIYIESLRDEDVAIRLRAVNAMIDEARRQRNTDYEGKAMALKISVFYCYVMIDSINEQKETTMDFLAKYEQWEDYYEVALQSIQTTAFDEGHYMMALRDCQHLYDFARQHNHPIGLAYASFVLGDIYSKYYHDYKEATRLFEQSLSYFRRMEPRDLVVDVYSGYLSVLEYQKRFDDEERVIGELLNYLDRLCDGNKNDPIYMPNLGEVRATQVWMETKRGNLRAAARYVAELKQLLNRGQIYYYYNACKAIANYYFSIRDYQQAEVYIREMSNAPEGNSRTARTEIRRFRANLLRGQGRFEAAAALLDSLLVESDTAINLQLQTQLNEMTTLYRLDDLRMEQQKAKTRYIVIMAALAFVALVVFIIFRSRAARRLKLKNDELAVALDHAQESDRMKSAFIRHISHEIRTPLNIITGFAQVVSSPEFEVTEEDRSKMLNDISHNTQEITNFVNALIELSESESRAKYALDEPVVINRLCRDALSEAQNECGGRLQMSFETALTDDFVLNSNGSAISKILRQLFKNAMKFTANGSVVLRASLDKSASEVSVSVEDTGVGIPAGQEEKVFEQFYKVDTFKQGIGLGLTMARQIAVRLGGTLVVDPAYTDGARLVLTLPVTV
ncbi:MAG: HAMP domain-containing histidine kinase [Prevotella sp.]|nr:HAMP domain-containing histidine kinase [Prevotella sp.]